MAGLSLQPISDAGFRFRPLFAEYSAEAGRRFGQFVRCLLRPLIRGLAAGRFEGYVARAGRRVAGAVVFGSHRCTARISFLHASSSWRNQGVEEQLLDAALYDLFGAAGSRKPGRILCEPMVVSHADPDAMFMRRGFEVSARRIMRAGLAPPVSRGRLVLGSDVLTRDGRPVRLRGWQTGDLRPVVEVLRTANQVSVDRNVYPELLDPEQAEGAIRGVIGGSCGRFDRRSTGVATTPAGAVVGVLLCSRCGPRQAFVVEVAVDPAWQGRGVGTALLARTMGVLPRLGVTGVTLGVTLANTPALRLYDRAGFQPEGRFSSYLWSGEGASCDVHRPVEGSYRA